MKPKIFCVGFQKTGTTTMAHALRNLGFTVGQPPKLVNKKVNWDLPDPRREIEKVLLDAARKHDALQDSPCAFFHEELDAAFPGAKFILTERDVDSWLSSYLKFFPNRNNKLRAWMYDSDHFLGNEALYRKIYDEQNNAIRNYFSDRPQDFIIMDLEAGDGWVKLVNFLGPILKDRFPHLNKGKNERKNRPSGKSAIKAS